MNKMAINGFYLPPILASKCLRNKNQVVIYITVPNFKFVSQSAWFVESYGFWLCYVWLGHSVHFGHLSCHILPFISVAIKYCNTHVIPVSYHCYWQKGLCMQNSPAMLLSRMPGVYVYVFVFSPKWDMHWLRAKKIKDSPNSQAIPKILVHKKWHCLVSHWLRFLLFLQYSLAWLVLLRWLYQMLLIPKN